MSATTTVVKVSGKQLDDHAFLDGLCHVLATMPTKDHHVILVHGGGKEITATMDRFGQQPTFIDGLRVTPPETMLIMEMVVSGSINKRIVSKLVSEGRAAIGLSGIDLGILRCVPHRPAGIDLGRVGEVTKVDVPTIRHMLDMGWLPVFAPVALGQEDGLSYNVNADHVAQALAAALAHPDTGIGPTEVVFISNVPGVLIRNRVIPELTASEIETAIEQKSIVGGMIPKVRSALGALAAGVTSARITNLEGLESGGSRIV